LPDDLAIFLHLLSPSGEIVAQQDALDAAPATLKSGDWLIQYHVIDVPESLPNGPYSLQLGMYQRSDGRRLLINDTSTDRITLYDALFLTND